MESLEDKSRLVFWDIEALKLQDSENMRFFLEALFYYLRGNGFGTGFHIRPVAANRHHTRVSVAVLNSLHGCGITPEFVRPGADLKLPKQLADRRISSHMFTWMEPERAEPGVVVLLAHDGHYINAIREILRLGHSAVLIYKGSVNTNLYQLPWSGKVNIRYLKRRYARHLREGNPPEGGVGENSDGDSDDDDADDDGHAIGGGDVFPPTPPTTGIFDPIVFANHGFQFVPGGGFRIWHASTGAHQEELELRRWNGEAIGALESDPNDIMRGVYSSGIALNCVPYGTDLIREFTPTERDLLPIMADVEQAVSAAAGVPKEGAFKKISIRGVELMSTEDLVKLLSSRIRRRFSKGLTRKPMALIKKLRKAKREAPQGEKPEPVRTLLRNTVIVPEMIGSIIGVYIGKTFNQVEIKPEMIGHYLAEFSISY